VIHPEDPAQTGMPARWGLYVHVDCFGLAYEHNQISQEPHETARSHLVYSDLTAEVAAEGEMAQVDFLKSIGQIKTPFALAGFAIAAVVAVFRGVLGTRRTQTKASVWVVVVAICILALVPIAIDSLTQRMKTREIYRIRVLTVDEQGIPVRGATVIVTAVHEATTATDGSCEISIPKATLPDSGKLTIYAGLDDRHGKVELTLGSDANPSLTIPLLRDRTAGLHGLVEDEDLHGLSGVQLVVSGAPMVTSDKDGEFSIPPFAAPGESVRVHAEKTGFKPKEDRYLAGAAGVTILMEREGKRK